MRPRRLILEGFRSHQRRTELDFSGRNLIAIVGPTGAGKSSILDGISFALFGKTPREQKSPQKLICSRGDEAKVSLDFELDGKGYEIQRVVRRKGSVTPVLVSRDTGEDFKGTTEVNDKVAELLGLDFSAFCSSVLLAQGEFARFLSAAETQRNVILKGVFRLDQIDALQAAAKRRTQSLDLELSGIEGERRAIPANLPQLMREQASLSEAAIKLAARFERALPEEERLERALFSATRERELALQELERLVHGAERLPDPGDFEELAGHEHEVVPQLAAARDAMTTAEGRRRDAGERLAKLERRSGGEAELARLRGDAERLHDEAGELDAIEGNIKSELERLEELGGLVEAAEAMLEQATERSAAAAERVRAAEVEHRAHALRGDLVVGEPCPVCEQKVVAVPKGGPPEILTGVREQLARADKEESSSREALHERKLERQASEVKLRNLKEQRDSLATRLELLRDSVRTVLGDVEDPLRIIGERFQELTDSRRAAQEAQRALDAARDRLGRLEAAFKRVAGERVRLASALIGVAGFVDLEPPDVESDLSELEAFFRSATEAFDRRAGEARTRSDESRKVAERQRRALAELRTNLELGEDVSITDAMAEQRANAKVAQAQLENYSAQSERAAELEKKGDEVMARRNVFGRLHEDLAPRNFLGFLIEERTHLLLELASERLKGMTDRYRLELDGKNLNVVDEFDAEKRRGVGTLSGGETFLASLALALALAEMVGRHGGRLQSFFLDEGFGTLDPESFDLAMDGIERIVVGDRLIGLVSHVPALAARVDDRIELARGPDGMSVVKEGGSLG